MVVMNPDWRTKSFNEQHLPFVNVKTLSACHAATTWLQSVFQVEVNYFEDNGNLYNDSMRSQKQAVSDERSRLRQS